MSLSSAKDQLPFVGFLTPKRDLTEGGRPAPIARRSTGEEDASAAALSLSLDSRDTGAILATLEPATPDSRLLGSYTPDSSGSRWGGVGASASRRHNYSGSERGFETPGRKLPAPGRTFLQERMLNDDVFDSTLATTLDDGSGGAAALGSGDFLSPDRDWGKRGRPRADEITSLIMEGSQSGSNIKCHICSR